MGWRVTAIGLSAAMAWSPAFGGPASDKPEYGPPPSWVHEVPIPTDLKPTGAAVDVLLLNQQTRQSPGADESFFEVATRVNASEGLASLGSLVQAWDPSTQSLAIHRARVIRDGKSIDLLAGGKTFTVIRRETNLEAASIDGELTATLQPEGLRVGDIVDLAVSYVVREPALAGHSQATFVGVHAGSVHRVVLRTSWPKARPPHTFETDDLPRFTRAEIGDRIEIGFEQTDAVNPEPPKHAPPFESSLGVALMSDFADWADLSRTLYPLFEKAATLAPDSPLHAEIARIAAAHPDPNGRALAAWRLVEDDVRYLAVTIDAGGYTPAAADVTWSRRYGDCKGKTVLLMALLRGLGVEARPALVSTSAGDGLDRLPATLSAFNHVIVRATINGKVYWLDGTRQGDEDLDIVPVPRFHYALPLVAAGSELEPLAPKDPALPIIETRLNVDLTAGLDKPATLRRQVITRGDFALGLKLALTAMGATDRDRALRHLLANDDWMKPDKLDFTYDAKTMTFTGTMLGKGAPPFTYPEGAGSSARDWDPAPSFVNVSSELQRTGDYHRDAPYAVDYPNSSRDLVEIVLPDRGRGFTVNNGGAVSRAAGGIAYSRAATLNDSRFVEVISRHALVTRFPASEADAAQSALRTLRNYEVSLRYAATAPDATRTLPDAPTLPPPPAPALPPETDPEARARDAFVAKDYVTAETEYGKAIAAKPSAKLYYNRAVTRGAMGSLVLAEADLKQAVALDPHESMALFGLGRLALQRSQFPEASRFFNASLDAASAKATTARRIAQSYYAARRYADAAPFWDRTVEADQMANVQKAHDLAAACWTRTRVSLEVQKAHAMCEEALTLAPKDLEVLNLAGFSDIRIGSLPAAVANFDQALVVKPGSADALFGRSIAERKLGQVAKANADRDTAVAADPKVADGTETFTSR